MTSVSPIPRFRPLEAAAFDCRTVSSAPSEKQGRAPRLTGVKYARNHFGRDSPKEIDCPQKSRGFPALSRRSPPNQQNPTPASGPAVQSPPPRALEDNLPAPLPTSVPNSSAAGESLAQIASLLNSFLGNMGDVNSTQYAALHHSLLTASAALDSAASHHFLPSESFFKNLSLFSIKISRSSPSKSLSPTSPPRRRQAAAKRR